MIRQCDRCGTVYDDAACFTACPHEQFLSDGDLAQKDLAISLVGKRVRFHHQPDGPDHRIQSVGWNGMVTIDGMVGEFPPHLFFAVEEPSR